MLLPGPRASDTSAIYSWAVELVQKLSRLFDDFTRAQTAQDLIDVKLGEQDVILQAQIDRLNRVLAGTEEFTGLNVGGVDVKPFLDKTDGDKLIDVTGLADGLVSTAKVELAAITDAEASAVSGLTTLSGSSETTVATRAYSTTGGELEISVNFHLTLWHPTAGGIDCRIRVYRDATVVFDKTFEAVNGDLLQGWQTPRIIETPAAGTYTYSVTAQASNSGYATGEVDAASIVVREFKR
jgi:hypothetical protein